MSRRQKVMIALFTVFVLFFSCAAAEYSEDGCPAHL